MNPLLIGGIIDTVGKVADSLFTSDEERAKLQIEGLKAETEAYRAESERLGGQLEVNKAEAASASVFVAGWRPFIGWVCGSACAWNWIGLPVAKVLLPLAGGPAIALEQADLTEMLPVLMGMLGLAGYRTFESQRDSQTRRRRDRP